MSIHYSKKLGKHESQAVISVESRHEGDVEEYLEKLVENKYQFENINDKEDMLDMFFWFAYDNYDMYLKQCIIFGSDFLDLVCL